MDATLLALVEAGLVSPADADRIDRTLDPDAARLHAEQMLTDAFQGGLTAQQRRILGLVNDANGRPTARQLSLFWEDENDLLWTSVGDDIVNVASEQAVRASIGAIDDLTWQLVNENVIEWAETYYLDADSAAFGSIPNLNLTSRTAFERAFVDWQRGELDVFGRTATGELRQGLDALIAALEPTFGVGRAEKIAVTETSRVFAQSEIAAAHANPHIVYLQWLTSNDEMVCPICGPRADLVVGKEQDGFRVATDNTVGYPPAHVRCRCSLTQLTAPAFEALREQGLAVA